MVGIIYKNGNEIDRGIISNGKHFKKEYPKQQIEICDWSTGYEISNPRNYTHNDGISFKEFENDKLTYDSNNY